MTLLCARDIIIIMTYLIVPDIHQEINQLNEILIKYNHIQKKISLGDWYDTHGDNDTPNDVAEVAECMRILLIIQIIFVSWGTMI